MVSDAGSARKAVESVDGRDPLKLDDVRMRDRGQFRGWRRSRNHLLPASI
jgi:hypothetical protein